MADAEFIKRLDQEERDECQILASKVSVGEWINLHCPKVGRVDWLKRRAGDQYASKITRQFVMSRENLYLGHAKVGRVGNGDRVRIAELERIGAHIKKYDGQIMGKDGLPVDVNKVVRDAINLAQSAFKQAYPLGESKGGTRDPYSLDALVRLSESQLIALAQLAQQLIENKRASKQKTPIVAPETKINSQHNADVVETAAG